MDKQEPVALLPCPFCGGTSLQVCGIEGPHPNAYGCAECLDCETQGPEKPTKAEAIAAWNTRANRPADDGLVAVIANLQAQMEAQADNTTPSSVQRDKGLVWLEGWFDLATALRAQSDAEVERIVAWLNQLGDIWSARQIAAMIEAGEHRKDGV